MNYLIVGAGLSGQSLANALYHKSKNSYIYDDKEIKKDLHIYFNEKKSKVINQEEAISLIEAKDSIILTSPGVPDSHPLLERAREYGCRIICEVEYALAQTSAKIISITGTNGKSTVASMCQHILEASGYSSELLGNIGTPVSSILVKKSHPQFLVLELSSYQLDQIDKPDFFCSVFTNFSEDHLERHGTLENYFKAKSKVFQTTKTKESCGFWIKDLESQAEKYGFYSQGLMPIKQIDPESVQNLIPKNLQWPKHNLVNATFALEACSFVTKSPKEALANTLATFKTIPHRFEVVAQTKNTIFINDSKATNINATVAALEALSGDIMLLLGGLSKSSEYSELFSHCGKINSIVTFGKSGPDIAKAFEKRTALFSYENLRVALKELKQLHQKRKPKYILLAPACASFDEFINFSARGSFFKEKILSEFKEDIL